MRQINAKDLRRGDWIKDTKYDWIALVLEVFQHEEYARVTELCLNDSQLCYISEYSYWHDHQTEQCWRK